MKLARLDSNIQMDTGLPVTCISCVYGTNSMFVLGVST